MIEQYRGTVPPPFEPGDYKRIAVKVIDDREIESLNVVGVKYDRPAKRSAIELLDGRGPLATGGGNGIGRGCALRFACEGARVMSYNTGVNGFPGLATYSGTKGAPIALARGLAIDHSADAVRVKTIARGTIDSPMLHEFVASQQDPVRTRKAFDQIQPRGRVGTIEEVVNVVNFLASDQSSLVSGANICADGAASIKGEQPRL